MTVILWQHSINHPTGNLSLNYPHHLKINPMTVSDENIHLFDPFRVGDLTDKGIIQDLFFLQFGSGVGAYRIYEPKGRGILMARVNGKDHAIGNLKLIKD
jgi:hypothetical protein